MPRYKKHEARDWAKVHMTGCDNVIIPSYTADLKALNEQGIRHDVRRCIELGFSGTLLVSEVNITVDEYRQFAEWAVDEAKGKLRIVHHASWNTLEENIETARLTQAAGAEYVLMSYPANFYPSSFDEVYEYTKAYCDAIDMGVMLFPVPLWNFGRLHPGDIPPKMLRKMVDAIPNIIAIKAEGALPSIAGLLDVYRQFKDVVISCLVDAGFAPVKESNRDFFVGRNPVESARVVTRRAA